MSQAGDKSRKGRGKKLAIRKEPVVKDLAPKRSLKAGAASRTADWKIARNHNETLVRDA